MARPAPAVSRTIKLLKFLAQHPKDRFTLSEISRSLEMNKATVHAMLATLLSEGVLIRHPSDKTYSLGPALIGLGEAASIGTQQVLEFTMPELVAIAQELNVSCVASTLIDFDLVIVARRDVDRPVPGYLPVGHRWAIYPPQGREFMAWAEPDRVNEWMSRSAGRLTARLREHYLGMLQETRRLGYVLMTPEVIDLQRLISSLPASAAAQKLQNQLNKLVSEINSQGAIEAGSDPSVLANAVISPIFGPDGKVVMALSISGFPPNSNARDIARYAKRLTAGTRRVTEIIHGRAPEFDDGSEAFAS
jgi:DNA-binding IclR family transcriptional regulator